MLVPRERRRHEPADEVRAKRHSSTVRGRVWHDMASVSTGQGRSSFGMASFAGNERLAWYFLRISGVALVFFALGHLFITHYLNAPSETGFDFVAARWANP